MVVVPALGSDVEYIRDYVVNVGSVLGISPLRDGHEEDEGEKYSQALHTRTKVYCGPHPISISGPFSDGSRNGSRRISSMRATL